MEGLATSDAERNKLRKQLLAEASFDELDFTRPIIVDKLRSVLQREDWVWTGNSAGHGCKGRAASSVFAHKPEPVQLGPKHDVAGGT